MVYVISSQRISFILPSLPGSWFINLSYGEFSKIVPVISYSSESRISERENWNTFYKGFFQLPAVRTVAVFSLLFVDTNSVMVQLKRKTIHPILYPSKGVVLHWYRDQGSDASLIWPQEEPHYCVPSDRKHQLCDEIERPLQLQHDKMCLFCAKVGQRTALKRRQREKGKIKRKWSISENKTNFLEVI